MRVLLLALLVGIAFGQSIRRCENGPDGKPFESEAPAYVWLSNINGGDTPLYKVDAKKGCAMEQLYTDNRRYGGFSLIACDPHARWMAAPMKNDEGHNTLVYYDTIKQQKVGEVRTYVDLKYMAWNPQTQAALLLYSGNDGSWTIGSPPTPGVGQELLDFKPSENVGRIWGSFDGPGGGYGIHDIATFDYNSQTYYVNFLSDEETYSYIYMVPINDTSNYNRISHKLRPIKMFYDQNSDATYLVYTTGGRSECNPGGGGEPNPTNPRTRSVKIGKVTQNGVEEMVTLNYPTCIRNHAISAWNHEKQQFLYYTQYDTGSQRGDYRDGIGYAQFNGWSGSVEGTANFFGNNIDEAIWGVCGIGV